MAFFCFLPFILHAQKNIHHRWNNLTQKYVSNKGEVNYSHWKKDQRSLEIYIETLEKFPPPYTSSSDYKLSYWINIYNALTVQLILNNYPLKSIKDLRSPWRKKLLEIGGQKYSLNDIEHNILRKMNEPRIHFAINCASKSCPKLLNEAYQEKKLNNQLDQATRNFLSDSTKNILNNLELKLSKIFLWYGNDFGSKEERLNFIAKYSDIVIERPNINYMNYNWDLNQ